MGSQRGGGGEVLNRSDMTSVQPSTQAYAHTFSHNYIIPALTHAHLQTRYTMNSNTHKHENSQTHIHALYYIGLNCNKKKYHRKPTVTNAYNYDAYIFRSTQIVRK